MRGGLQRFYIINDEITMTASYYDSLWDQKLQADYKAGRRGLAANRQPCSVSCPSDDDFLVMPASTAAADKKYGAFLQKGAALLSQGKLGVIHLNGGLATRFGQIKATHEAVEMSGRPRTFLELKIGHVRWVCKTYGGKIIYGLMNSPMTLPVTEEFLKHNRGFGLDEKSFLPYVQSVLRRKVPRREDIEEFYSGKTRDETYVQSLNYIQGREGEFFNPSDAAHQDLQWAPAGHFDAVASLVLTRALAGFLEAGVEYLQISNIDNLAATIEPAILGILADSQEDVMVEVALKKPGDRGGVPVRVDGRGIVLVEEFALPKSFDGDRARQFNTGTYWVKIARVLNLLGISARDVVTMSQEYLARRVRDVREKIPVYAILKKVDMPHVGEILLVQDEQLLGDMTRLYLESTGRSALYLLIDTAKRFIPVKTKEDLVREGPRIREVLRHKVLLD